MAFEHAFASEDFVMLVSGGPRMRVVQREHDICLCEWVAADGRRYADFFLACCLVPWPTTAHRDDCEA
jgi:uncharacterized protein YodC (DUF2158 family)